MPWSVDVGPVRYHQPASKGEPALWTVLKVLLGFACVGLIVAVVALFGVAVAGAWLVGLAVGACRSDAALSRRYATAVVDWGREMVGIEPGRK